MVRQDFKSGTFFVNASVFDISSMGLFYVVYNKNTLITANGK